MLRTKTDSLDRSLTLRHNRRHMPSEPQKPLEDENRTCFIPGVPVQFESIKKGTEWERNELAELWGYRSFHAIARGVFTPANQNLIVLFVTEDKQESLTQYEDRLSGKRLHWEGEDKHQNDSRIADASKVGNEIHVFHRKRHHTPFTYLGEVRLISSKLLTDKPSEFVFEQK